MGKRWLPRLLIVVAVISAVIAGFCRHYRVYSYEGWEVYQFMEAECHPAWRDYHFGHISAGDSVEDVIARTQPIIVERKGNQVFLKYQQRGGLGTSLCAVAYDGRMVFAFATSCAWTRVFFDELTDEQNLEMLGRPKDDPLRYGRGIVVR
ncbi:hypothetical protein [Zavarzinella formosa]|uniref:hypothetical protein n=1 Tax=Zavarzinella formosa TaxID=360055 RepID=UPI000312EE3A|nr:hypothetical protein [Zavarzinella formosa]